jgi:UDP-glucose 4-epimerase
MTAVTWVVGAGGLLGSAVARALDERGPRWVQPRAVVWEEHATAVHQLETLAGEFMTAVGSRPWQVAWCAGEGVTGSTTERLRHEHELFSSLLDELRRLGDPDGCVRGTVFVGSSAGALYAGSPNPPFSEESPVAPISAYGLTKVDMEEVARRWAEQTGGGVVLGRIANLYGPAQNLRKSQGLISQIIRSHLLRAPISIYVPLDTTRDYIYADDCGGLIADVLAGFASTAVDEPRVLTKIFASHRGVTVGAMLGEMRRVFKRAPQIVLGSSPQASLQARDLRLRSCVEPVLPGRLTPLAVGINVTATHLRLLLGQGRLREGDRRE